MTGAVTVRLYKGTATVLGRDSDQSLYDEQVASMEADDGAYDQTHATGFIHLKGLPLRAHARRVARNG